jgi:hypothetical protein
LLVGTSNGLFRVSSTLYAHYHKLLDEHRAARTAVIEAPDEDEATAEVAGPEVEALQKFEGDCADNDRGLAGDDPLPGSVPRITRTHSPTGKPAHGTPCGSSQGATGAVMRTTTTTAPLPKLVAGTDHAGELDPKTDGTGQ